jgi:hypothetical protein
MVMIMAKEPDKNCIKWIKTLKCIQCANFSEDGAGCKLDDCVFVDKAMHGHKK